MRSLVPSSRSVQQLLSLLTLQFCELSWTTQLGRFTTYLVYLWHLVAIVIAVLPGIRLQGRASGCSVSQTRGSDHVKACYSGSKFTGIQLVFKGYSVVASEFGCRVLLSKAPHLALSCPVGGIELANVLWRVLFSVS